MMKGILIDESNELLIQPGRENGWIISGLQVGETSEQNAQLIIVAEKGEFKEYPQLGVGISRYLHSVGRENEMIREIKVQLALDGMSDPQIDRQDGKLLHIQLK